MNHQTEALKLAFDFISRLKFADAEPEPERVMEAIKKALDRVDPAPVAKNEEGRIKWLVDDWPPNCLLYAEPPSWTPVEIGVDVTNEGAHVVGMYVLMPDVVRHVFHSQFHPAPQRTWVGLTDEEIDQGLLRSNYALQTAGAWRDGVEWAQSQLKEKNNGS